MYIINGDDFGLSENVNTAIARCFREGLINRTTILVNMPGAEEACAIAQEQGFKGSVGLHINLVEGPAMTEVCRKNRLLCDEDGCFHGEFCKRPASRFFADRACREAMEAEIEAQIQKYIAMGFPLMHADSHRYLHTYPVVARVAEPLLVRYGFRSVRISRNLPENGVTFPFSIYKQLYNRHIRSVDGLVTTQYFGSMDDFLQTPKKEDAEIMVHPVMRDGVLMDDTLPAPKTFFDKEFLRRRGIVLQPVDRLRKRLLVVFPKNHIGGSMTSLVNFLQTIDPERFEVDVLFGTIVEGMPKMPEHVQILEQAKLSWNRENWRRLLLPALNPLYYATKLLTRLGQRFGMSETVQTQLMSMQGCRFTRRPEKEYDIALAYELNWCMYYLERYVKAKRKAVLMHNDYHAIGYNFSLDRPYFERMDALGFVSDACMGKFLEQHPQYKQKSYFVPNITARQPVLDRAEEPMEVPLPEMAGKLRLLSVSRVSFDAKGTDRILPVCLRLREEGLLDKLCWVVLGGGGDLKRFRRMIQEQGLENTVFTLGKIKNPMPYLRHFDAMVLPSRNEGKPMAVTEAQIMGLPPVVARYTSAGTQIEHTVDGLIFENNDEMLYRGIKDLVLHPEKLEQLRKNLNERRYSNEEDIEYFYRMVDALFA